MKIIVAAMAGGLIVGVTLFMASRTNGDKGVHEEWREFAERAAAANFMVTFESESGSAFRWVRYDGTSRFVEGDPTAEDGVSYIFDGSDEFDALVCVPADQACRPIESDPYATASIAYAVVGIAFTGDMPGLLDQMPDDSWDFDRYSTPIAGREGQCFIATETRSSETLEACFSEDHAIPLRFQAETQTLEVVEFGQPTARDAELPFPPVDTSASDD